jgi:uncharacterized RDD family membrane protein YckC
MVLLWIGFNSAEQKVGSLFVDTSVASIVER